MLIKVVLVFLGVMALVAFLGKAFLSGLSQRTASRGKTNGLKTHGLKTGACPSCGKLVPSGQGCDCGGKVR